MFPYSYYYYYYNKCILSLKRDKYIKCYKLNRVYNVVLFNAFYIFLIFLTYSPNKYIGGYLNKSIKNANKKLFKVIKKL